MKNNNARGKITQRGIFNPSLAIALLLAFLLMIALGGCGGGGSDGGSGTADGGNEVVDEGGNSGGDSGSGDVSVSDDIPGSGGNTGGGTVGGGGTGGGGTGGGGSYTGPATKNLNVKIHDFKLADWSEQEWQKALKPDGELNPFVPVSFLIDIEGTRPGVTVDDTVWVALSLIDGTKAMLLAADGFSSPREEPVDDPLYLGFCQLELNGGRETMEFGILPRLSARPGNYTGIRAEVFIPGEGGDIQGATIFEWKGSVELLAENKVPVVDEHWTEVTINADPPMDKPAAEQDGFDVSDKALVDPITGFRRLFGNDTPEKHDTERTPDDATPKGYYAEIYLGLEIMAQTGKVSYLEITENSGKLQFWDFEKHGFENKLVWHGKHVKPIDSFVVPGNLDSLFEDGFSRGLNGTTVIVGAWSNVAPPAAISDLRFAINAYDKDGKLLSSVAEAHDATIKKQLSARRSIGTARGADEEKPDYPFVLPVNANRIDLPLDAANQKLSFSSNSFTWKEELTGSKKWESSKGPSVDYKGGGTRTIYGSEIGDKSTFAARTYMMFEEYSGLTHSVPVDGVYTIHDVSTIAGTRTAAEAAVWAIGEKFTILFAGAELRSEIFAQVPTERSAKVPGEQHKLASTAGLDYGDRYKMETEFNVEVALGGVSLLSFPLAASSSKPFDPGFANKELFKYELSPEPAVKFVFYVVSVRVGIRANADVTLQLSSALKPITNGVNGTGRIAIIPSLDVKGFMEAGFDAVVVSAYVGFELRFVKFTLTPAYELNGKMTWANGTSGPPVVTAEWTGGPRLDLDISTLDGTLYLKYEVFFVIEGREDFFSWKGFTYSQNLWKGNPRDRGALALELTRRKK